jgi:ubiquinone/menaquinone biosynthesis C-methylase UbiE
MGYSDSRRGFALMAFKFKIRDIFSPPERILAEAGIRPGATVLDFGCGPGGFIAAASKLVGDSGAVYALDRRREALDAVGAVIAKRRLMNVRTILSDCATGLPGRSVDVVLLYDTFHAFDPAEPVLAELHRVLKEGGTLSFSDHHLSDAVIREQLAAGGHFVFIEKGRKTYEFQKRT